MLQFWKHFSVHTYPVSVLEGPDEEVDEPGDGAVLAEGRVVGRAEGQVADQSDHGLHQGPPKCKQRVKPELVPLYVM